MTTFSQPSAAGLKKKQCFQSLSRMSRTLLTPTKVLWFFNNLQTNIQKYFAHGLAIMFVPFYVNDWVEHYDHFPKEDRIYIMFPFSPVTPGFVKSWSVEFGHLAQRETIVPHIGVTQTRLWTCWNIASAYSKDSHVCSDGVARRCGLQQAPQQIQFTPPELPFLFYKVVPAELCWHYLIGVSNCDITYQKL